jgi:hypothetical protein
MIAAVPATVASNAIEAGSGTADARMKLSISAKRLPV